MTNCHCFEIVRRQAVRALIFPNYTMISSRYCRMFGKSGFAPQKSFGKCAIAG
ncbi:hypothetical protein N9A13_02945 [Alphaproteobacteria bacterium]|nr:hypothetical protein [Alphaproteobacteria bacterium]